MSQPLAVLFFSIHEEAVNNQEPSSLNTAAGDDNMTVLLTGIRLIECDEMKMLANQPRGRS